ncbi:hypothetical protein Aperf_G00000062496 [Anoplocephala perfoliata]
MAWLDHNQNDSPFQEPLDYENPNIPQLLVLVFRAYFSPIIFIHGFFANILALVTFCRIQRRTPGRFNLYAIAIIISFLLILIFDTLLDDFFGRGLGWLTHHRLALKLDQISSASCKVITYATDSTSFIATSILAVFGVDRARTVCFPLHFRADRHIRCAMIMIIAIAVIGLTLFSPTFVFYDIVRSNSTNLTSCTLTDPSLPGATYTLLIYVLGSYSLPTLVIIVCNILILFRLGRIKRKNRKYGFDVTSPRDIRRIIGHLAISTSFLLLMVPLVVVVLMRYESSIRLEHYSVSYRIRLIHLSRFFSSLLSVSFSSIFWVFFFFLPTFRDAVLELFLDCPMVASSMCGACLYRHMTYGGARRFRAKSMTPSLMYLAPLASQTVALRPPKELGFNARNSLPASSIAILISKPKRSISAESIV